MSLFASCDDADDRALVTYLAGDIDLANAEAHGDGLCRLLDDSVCPTMVVNCTRLELLESQGMAMMHRVHTHGTELGIRVVWRGLRPNQRRLLELTGLDHYLVLDDPGGDEHSSAVS